MPEQGEQATIDSAGRVTTFLSNENSPIIWTVMAFWLMSTLTLRTLARERKLNLLGSNLMSFREPKI